MVSIVQNATILYKIITFCRWTHCRGWCYRHSARLHLIRQGGGSIKKRRHLCKAHSRHFVPHDSVLNPYPDGSGFFRRSGLRKKVRSGSGQQDPDPKHCIFKQTHKNSTALQLAYTNYYQSIPEGIDPEILVHINHLVYR